jgi:hypothetical protein
MARALLVDVVSKSSSGVIHCRVSCEDLDDLERRATHRSDRVATKSSAVTSRWPATTLRTTSFENLIVPHDVVDAERGRCEQQVPQRRWVQHTGGEHDPARELRAQE